MKKILVVIMAVVLAVLVVACAPSMGVIPPPNPSGDAEPEAEPERVAVANLDATGIMDVAVSPAFVIVGSADGVLDERYFAGKKLEVPLTIWNGRLEDVECSIGFTLPPEQDGDYVIAPDYVGGWVTIGTPYLIVPAREAREVLITLHMPTDAETFAPKWEFRIVVVTEGGQIRTANSSRWLIEMRD